MGSDRGRVRRCESPVNEFGLWNLGTPRGERRCRLVSPLGSPRGKFYLYLMSVKSGVCDDDGTNLDVVEGGSNTSIGEVVREPEVPVTMSISDPGRDSWETD